MSEDYARDKAIRDVIGPAWRTRTGDAHKGSYVGIGWETLYDAIGSLFDRIAKANERAEKAEQQALDCEHNFAHVDAALAAVTKERDEARAEREKVREGCFCFSCEGAALCDEDGCCSTCGAALPEPHGYVHITTVQAKLDQSAAREGRLREALKDSPEHATTCRINVDGRQCDCLWVVQRKAALSDSDLSPTVELLRAALAWADVREELSNTSTADPKLYDSMATAERQAREYLRAKAAPVLAARRKERRE